MAINKIPPLNVSTRVITEGITCLQPNTFSSQRKRDALEKEEEGSRVIERLT